MVPKRVVTEKVVDTLLAMVKLLVRVIKAKKLVPELLE
jgi:hypothetical protein